MGCWFLKFQWALFMFISQTKQNGGIQYQYGPLINGNCIWMPVKSGAPKIEFQSQLLTTLTYMKIKVDSIKCISILILSLILFQNANSTDPIHSVKSPPRKTHQQALKQNASLTLAVERLLTNIEKNIIDVAEAMPEDKFDFTPEHASISGSDFKDVRTFAGQVKHLATDNFAIWTPLTGQALRADIVDVNGPAGIKTKADIIKYLKESFALGHTAVANLTDQNAMEMISFRGSDLPRLDLAFYALTHSNEHYGQMVVYLRMCGIVPPASRPK